MPEAVNLNALRPTIHDADALTVITLSHVEHRPEGDFFRVDVRGANLGKGPRRVVLECEWCGAAFSGTVQAKFCGARCRMRHHRAKETT